MPGAVFHSLYDLWQRRRDEYIGTLVNAWIAEGGEAWGVRAGDSYIDVGATDGYFEAMRVLGEAAKYRMTLFPQKPPPRGAEHDRLRIAADLDAGRDPNGGCASWADWFQNMDLGGVKTAPDHFLGDYPACKWRTFAHAIPADLTGKTVLDIGCNAGFYSHRDEAPRRRPRGRHRFRPGLSGAGALCRRSERRRHRIPRSGCLPGGAAAARNSIWCSSWACSTTCGIRCWRSICLWEHVVGDMLVFQSLMRGSRDVPPLARDYPFWRNRASSTNPAIPAMYFVEKRYSHDPTNWWIPNRACAEAMLRSAGFEIIDHPEEEVYICSKER